MEGTEFTQDVGRGGEGRRLGTGVLVLLPPLVIAFHACTGDRGLGHLGVTFDSIAGVEHVISSGPGAWAGEGVAWSVDEAAGIVIGEIEGPESYVFGEISGVVVDPERQIFVADPQALEIRVFSPEGEFLRRIGREGEGPGEFRHISGLALAPGGIASLDGGLGRVTVFTPGGEVVRSFRLQRTYMILEHFGAMAFDSEGRYFDRARLSSGPGSDSVGVIAYRPDGTVSDTALLAVIEDDIVMIERNGMPYMSIPRPLSPRPSFSFGLQGTVFLSRGDEYRVDVFSPSGDSLRAIRRPVEARPVLDVQRDSAIAVVAEAFQMAGERVVPEIAFPDRNPVVVGLMPDSEGNLWVLQEGANENGQFEWSVHDSAGRYLGPVFTPTMTVTQIGKDFLAGTVKDDLGIAKAVVFPIKKVSR